MNASNTATLRVFRQNPKAGEQPHYDTYQVPVRLGLTVLEALFDILDKQDGSLSFRFSCRGAVCGSCGMYINGRYRLACATQVAELVPHTITIDPLPNLTVIKDLVVDMDPFFEKYERVRPYLINNLPEPEKERLQSQADRWKIDEMVDCILCACCTSSCPVAWMDKEFLGPAAYVQCNRFVADSRDHGLQERLPAIAHEHGVWRCHTIFNCAEACPKGINPTYSIQQLKKKASLEKLKFW